MVQLLKANNPNCFLVTGRPRTPRDQGSVENANKLVQRVLKSISSERRLKGLEVNWTNLLGQIMSICNSQTGMRSLSTSSYEAVFGQRYHPVLRCTVAEMRDCVSIFQRLKLSPDERLATYVKEHDIVDIELCDALEEDSDDDDDDESEGDEINDDTFPDCEKEDVVLCQEIPVDEESKDADLPDIVSDRLKNGGMGSSLGRLRRWLRTMHIPLLESVELHPLHVIYHRSCM